MDVCSEILEGEAVVALIEWFIVVDVLSRALNIFIAGWISCGVVVMVFMTPLCVVLTRCVGVSEYSRSGLM